MVKPITRVELLEFLDYCPETGQFTWKKTISKKRLVGMPAGCLDESKGYVKIGVNHGRYWAHRLAWLAVHGEFPELQIDHKDGNRSNNSIANLRLATQAENNQNQCTGRGHRKGKPIGVRLKPGSTKYSASITINRKMISLGCYETEQEAVSAYLEAKKKYHKFQPVLRTMSASDNNKGERAWNTANTTA